MSMVRFRVVLVDMGQSRSVLETCYRAARPRISVKLCNRSTVQTVDLGTSTLVRKRPRDNSRLSFTGGKQMARDVN